MRILLLSDFFLPSFGGVERVMLELARGLGARGHQVDVLTLRWQPAWPAQETIERIGVIRYPVAGGIGVYPSAVVAGRRAFRRQMAAARYDLIHCHLTLSALGPLLEPASRALPCVATFHGPWADEMWLEGRAKRRAPAARPLYGSYLWALCRALERAQRWVLARCQTVVALSRYSVEMARAMLPRGRRADIRLIPGGVDLARFCPGDRQAARRELGLPRGEFIIFTVRRLVPRMGLENLLAALACLAAQGAAPYLVIGGTGRLADSLREQAQELGIGDRVRFAGFVPEADLPRYYQAADLCVMPTLALEGFGLPTVEALACGVPVVGTPVGSTAEILAAFDARLLAQGSGAEALAAKIDEARGLLRAEDWAGRARAFATAHYGWDGVVGAYEALYRELCPAGAPAGGPMRSPTGAA